MSNEPTSQPSPLSVVDCTTALSAAIGYTKLCGFKVVPIPRRGKKPTLPGWENLRLSAAELPGHFEKPETNVGVLLGEPSNGLVDIDLDCREAVVAAQAYLPVTDACFGRATNRASHCLYKVTGDCRTHQFKAPDGTMLVEFRGTGGQTVFPGSHHKDTGEAIVFERAGHPAVVDGQSLLHATARIAITSLLARHWPVEGSRHLVSLALAGGLLRSGVPVEDAEQIIRVAATIAGDDDVDDRVTSVATTANRLNANEAATGWAELSTLIEGKVVKRIRQWLAEAGIGNAADAGQAPPHARYKATSTGLVYMKPTAEGSVPVPLTNWTARIVSDIEEDDGVEIRRHFLIEAVLAGHAHRRFSVPVKEFGSLEWSLHRLGAGAVVYPGFNGVAHAKAAIQLTSTAIDTRRVYGHTGWRKIDGAWYYLHTGGAIGKDGSTKSVEVSLEGSLANYRLPDPPTGEELATSVQASMRLLGLAPARMSYALFAAIPRAILGDADFSEFLVGPTGVFKTEYAALLQRHFGDDFAARRLPGSWTSTDNALEDLAFRAKDALFVIDDFKPSGARDDRLHQRADRVLRAQANGSGRQRLNSAIGQRPDRPPRSLILSTGEEVPRGQSLKGRSLIHELSKGDIDADELTACQHLADDGYFSKTTAAFCRWLAPQLDAVRKAMKERTETLRREFAAEVGESHARLPGILASLQFAMEVFLRFAVEATNGEALTESEAVDELDKSRAGMRECGKAQNPHQRVSEPAERFFQLLSSAIAAGKAHVAARDNSAPPQREAWGWRQENTLASAWKPSGDLVGWLDGPDLYLEMTAAYRAAQLQVADGDGLPVSERTLCKRLHEKGKLVTDDLDAQNTFFVRKVVGGSRRRVLHVRASDVVNTGSFDDSSIPI